MSCNGSSEDLGFCVDSCRWFNSCHVGIGEWGLAVYCRGFFFFSCGFFVEEEEEEDHACDI